MALGSGQASTIEFFCKKIQSKKASFEIKALITENPKSRLVKVAETFNLPYHIIEYKNKDFKKWDKELFQVLSPYKPQLILLAGFLKKIGPVVLNEFKDKIINSHPSLLPEFSGHGMYGLRVHQAVIREKKRETGVTIHIVNEDYDKGHVIAQKKIFIQGESDALSLEKKIKRIEKDFYFETVLKITKGEIFLP